MIGKSLYHYQCPRPWANFADVRRQVSAAARSQRDPRVAISSDALIYRNKNARKGGKKRSNFNERVAEQNSTPTIENARQSVNLAGQLVPNERTTQAR